MFGLVLMLNSVSSQYVNLSVALTLLVLLIPLGFEAAFQARVKRWVATGISRFFISWADFPFIWYPF